MFARGKARFLFCGKTLLLPPLSFRRGPGGEVHDSQTTDLRLNKHVPTGRRGLGLALAASTAFIWGTNPVILKGLVESLDAYTIACFRFFVSAGVSILVVARRHGIRSTFNAARSSPILLIFSIVIMTVQFTLFLSSLYYVSPSISQVVVQLSPILMLLGGLVLFGEKFGPRQWIGFGSFLVGLALFFNQSYAELLSGSSTISSGVLLVVASSSLLACYALAQKQLLTIAPIESTLFLIFLFGALLLLPLSNPQRLLQLNQYEATLLALVAFLTPISYLAFGEALDHLETSRVGIILGTNPLITISEMAFIAYAFPSLLEPEHLNSVSILGAVLVVVSSTLVSLSPVGDGRYLDNHGHERIWGGRQS